jgi:hypothetical protein
MPENGVSGSGSVLWLWSHLLRCRAIFDQRFHQKQSFHDQKMVGRLDPFPELTNPFCTKSRVFGCFCQFTSVEGVRPEFTTIQLKIIGEGQAHGSRERFGIETGAFSKHFSVWFTKILQAKVGSSCRYISGPARRAASRHIFFTRIS